MNLLRILSYSNFNIYMVCFCSNWICIRFKITKDHFHYVSFHDNIYSFQTFFVCFVFHSVFHICHQVKWVFLQVVWIWIQISEDFEFSFSLSHENSEFPVFNFLIITNNNVSGRKFHHSFSTFSIFITKIYSTFPIQHIYANWEIANSIQHSMVNKFFYSIFMFIIISATVIYEKSLTLCRLLKFIHKILFRHQPHPSETDGKCKSFRKLLIDRRSSWIILRNFLVGFEWIIIDNYWFIYFSFNHRSSKFFGC